MHAIIRSIFFMVYMHKLRDSLNDRLQVLSLIVIKVFTKTSTDQIIKLNFQLR